MFEIIVCIILIHIKSIGVAYLVKDRCEVWALLEVELLFAQRVTAKNLVDCTGTVQFLENVKGGVWLIGRMLFPYEID